MEPTITQPEAELQAGVKRTADDAFTGVDGCALVPSFSPFSHQPPALEVSASLQPQPLLVAKA